MNERSLAALIVLNVALLLGLGVLTMSPAPAEAQFGARADYLMIPGFAAGRESQEVVYIVERNSARMLALFYNSANNQIEVLAGRNIQQDVQGGGERGPR